MMKDLQNKIQQAIQTALKQDVVVVLSRPEPEFGDLATNVALQIAKQLGKNPREVAEMLVEALRNDLKDEIREVTIAGPGFINIRLSESRLLAYLTEVTDAPKDLAGKQIVAEYSDPNPFKVLHAGHLYTSIVGDAISNLLETAGGTVHRVNFGGDVGLHVGKTLWAILQNLGGEYPDKLANIPEAERAEWMARCYISGTNAFEDDPAAKQQIIALNKQVYDFHSANDKDSPLAQIYWTTRQWSYDYFDAFYERIGSAFEKYYPESTVADLGLQTVKSHIQAGIFEESDGAIVFRGEPHGLHTRVFINKEGLPTYEAKDVGLIMQKFEDYHFDKSVVITGNEQEQYMAVVLKAIEQFEPELVRATSHLTHGMVKLKGGVKMSSRKGNILRAVDVLEAAQNANSRADEYVTLGAVKYAFLKVRTGGDIIYDPKESVSIEGNSGPYLQYAHARARSVLRKATTKSQAPAHLEDNERQLVIKLTEYRDVLGRAVEELAPHIVCTYLYELAQIFNRFYEKNRVIADPREAERLYLIDVYTNVLNNGLSILGIHAPDTM